MAWARGKYYRVSIREGGTVRTRYYGKTGGLVALVDAQDRAERMERGRQARERDEAERQALEAERSRGESIRDLVTIALEGLGYAQHDRTWRRRGSMKTINRIRTLPDPEAAAAPPPAREEVRALIKRVEAGEKGARGELHRLVQAHPAIVAAETESDLAELAMETLAGTTFPKNDAAEEGLEARMRALCAELAPAGSGPALRLVAQAVVFAWAEHWVISTVVAMAESARANPLVIRRQDAAQRRFLAALRTHARIAALERRESSASPFDASSFATLFNQRGIENGHDPR